MISFDLELGSVREGDGPWLPLGSREGFELASRVWLRAGWDAKYVYRFTWLGRPVIQLPEDLIRVQEAIHEVRPTVVIETGVAHGGSLVFHASLLSVLGGGRVIGIDVEIRPHNRQAIETHELAGMITLIEGDSVAPDALSQVRSLLREGDRVMVLLDSAHTRRHVLAELEAYGPMVSPGSYLAAADGIMEDLEGAPRSAPGWGTDNPAAAVRDFLLSHPEFVVAAPAQAFNEGVGSVTPTYWKQGWLRRGAGGSGTTEGVPSRKIDG